MRYVSGFFCIAPIRTYASMLLMRVVLCAVQGCADRRAGVSPVRLVGLRSDGRKGSEFRGRGVFFFGCVNSSIVDFLSSFLSGRLYKFPTTHLDPHRTPIPDFLSLTAVRTHPHRPIRPPYIRYPQRRTLETRNNQPEYVSSAGTS